MSTTFDPSKDAHFHMLAKPTSNGKPETLPSQAAARPDFWQRRAPKQLRKETLSAEEAINIYWRERTPRASIATLCGATDTPLRWAMIAGSAGASAQKLVDLAGELSSRKGRRRAGGDQGKRDAQATISQWLDAVRNAPASYDLALGCVAAAHILGALGEAVSPAIAWRLLDFLTETARHSSSWNLGADAAPENIVAAQMLGGELPLTLAYLFGEMAPLEKAARPASDFVSESILELLNGQGLPRAMHLSALRPIAACWTRCQTIANEMKRARLAKNARRQFERLVRQAFRWTAPDGTALLAGGEAWENDFLRTMLRLGGAAKDAAAAGEMLGKQAAGKNSRGGKEPKTSYDCEWSCLAVMRSGWSPEDSVVAVDYSSPQMQLEVWAGKRRLFCGVLAAESRIDGKTLRPDGNWEELCWFSDKDVDYVELSLSLEGGARLERQVLLARRDGFLLVADHLQHSQTASLEHALQIPLAAGLLFCGEGETRDALLVDGKPLARLMPLALPEWRIDPRVGELSYSGGTVRLSERAAARSLACPLFVDLRARRSGEPATWRQLTVGELLEIQPADVAVSYRVQAGDDQWVYYRSQGPRGNRTFLGQNTASEFLLARFKSPSGEIKQLLEIEG